VESGQPYRLGLNPDDSHHAYAGLPFLPCLRAVRLGEV